MSGDVASQGGAGRPAGVERTPYVPPTGSPSGGAARFAGRGALSRFALVWGAPVLLWQGAFFVVPLLLLVAMTFWRVRNFRLSPDFTGINWVKVFSAPYFYTSFERTFLYALAAAAVATVLAFPCSYTLAYKVGATTRRLAVFLLITPFFTSYLVRAYAWQIILADDGLLNGATGLLGLGHVALLNTPVATVIGYLTLFFPLVILLQLTSLASVNRDLIEAAHNLGAPPWRTVIGVVIPAAKVGLLLGAAFAFMLAFGDFVSPTFLGGGKAPTLSILVIDTVKSASDWPRASVIALVMVVTLMIVLLATLALAYRGRGRTR